MNCWFWHISSPRRFGIDRVVWAKSSEEAFSMVRIETGYAGQLQGYRMFSYDPVQK
jgi:hypothetical protein